MVLLGSGSGFSAGRNTYEEGEVGKSLDDIIADRRKEDARRLSGRGSGAAGGKRNGSKGNDNKLSAKKKKDKDMANRSVATGRAKRAAATRSRRGLSNTNKPTAMEIDQENYRQARIGGANKKNSARRTVAATNKKKKQEQNQKKKKGNSYDSLPDPPAISFGRIPSKKQLEAALKGMQDAGCPIPDGHTLTMQFIPSVASTAPVKKNKGKANAGGGKGRNNGGRGGRK